MDLIDRAGVIQALQPKNDIEDFKYIFTSDTATCIVRNLPKVDAIPLSVIEEIKAELENLADTMPVIGKDYGMGIFNSGEIRGYRHAVDIIDRKVKEYTNAT